MKRIHSISMVVGLCWLAILLWIISSHVILRETSLGFVARYLDKLPPAIGTPVFFVLWAILLLGWVFLLGFGLSPLVRRQDSN
jgi:hypothetical protein